MSKPAGLLSTSRGDEPSLVAWAKARDVTAPRLHPSSRLDRMVCGLVVFSRHTEANKVLLEARKKGRYRRCYLALVHGRLSADCGEWTFPIAIDPHNPSRRIVAPNGAAGFRNARTVFRCLDGSPSASAVLLKPHTGRTHQLRVHASHATYPLLGDSMYGGKKQITLDDGSVLFAARPMLQCAAIQIELASRTLELSMDTAPDMVQLWSELGHDSQALRFTPDWWEIDC
ncbi:MAG: RNA pseudouridine synthase [Myxococcales bacterium]|nr:MAG: RNA pseudouridine synthase [Myxococcales bacterium]